MGRVGVGWGGDGWVQVGYGVFGMRWGCRAGEPGEAGQESQERGGGRPGEWEAGRTFYREGNPWRVF